MADIEEVESIPGQGAQPLEQREQPQRQVQGGQVEPVPGPSRGDQGQVQGEQEGPPRSLLPEGPSKPPLVSSLKMERKILTRFRFFLYMYDYDLTRGKN